MQKNTSPASKDPKWRIELVVRLGRAERVIKGALAEEVKMKEGTVHKKERETERETERDRERESDG